VVASLTLLLPGSASATSLLFYGHGAGDIDRVKVPIDDPSTSRQADVGATGFTLEWWMRAAPGANASDAVTCDANDGWITGNIVFDRDVFGPGDRGDFGVSLTGGRVAFGVSIGASGNTICGATDVTDGVWHHVAVTRRKSDGRLRIYVDGVLDAEGDGNVGPDQDVSYLDDRATSYPNSDPFLVIGAEKHDAGPAYPSYHGLLDEIRLSTVERYTASRFTRQFSAFVPDGNTAALYHLDEGAGDVVGDASGGGSHGTLKLGGTPPAGPAWSSESAPLEATRHVALEQVISGLAQPVAIASAGDGRLFVVEAAGRILAYEVSEAVPFTPLGTFLDIRSRVLSGGERGLLGVAFHPSYASNGYFFVYYTRKPEGDVVIARYQASPAGSGSVDPGTESILLTIPHSTFSNHNGGGMAFGPDGYLYASVGDGGGGGDALHSGQNLGVRLGKVLRLAVDVSGGPSPYYAVPPDNPFVGDSAAMPEIWAWGLRNPWRISIDRLTGDLFIGDVGQGNREEVNFQIAGGPGGVNYGWPRTEGTACYSPSSGCDTSGLVPPILDYSHDEGCAITGGYRYRGAAVPTLHGAYVFGDYCRGTVWVASQAGSGTWARAGLLSTGLSISTFGEDEAGELYLAHLGGSIHRFARVRPRLTVTRSGSGTGTVSGPGGLACGSACNVPYEPGEAVTLTVTPGASSWFAGWSGACSGTGSCTVLMDGDRSVAAMLNPRPVFQFSAATYSVCEACGSVTITVQRLGSTAGTATVDYAIEGGSATAPPLAAADFTPPGGSGGPLTGTLTFTPGQATRTFAIAILNDARAEGPETVLLSLHNPTAGGALGAQPTAVLTILDDDTAGLLQFTQTAYSTSETGLSFGVPVQRTGGGAETSVTWTIVGGSAVLGVDFDTPGGAASGALPFPANAGIGWIPLTLRRQTDTRADGARTIQLALSGPQPAGLAALGPRGAATLTITDNDTAGVIQFSPATLSVSEAVVGAKAVLTVTRSQKASGVSVDWAVTGGTAVAGTDYAGPTSGTLTFDADVLTRPIELALLDRDGAQGSRTVVVTLSHPTGGATLGGQKTATLTITDDEIGLQFSQPGYAVSEGSGGATITVVRTGPPQAPVAVSFTTTAPSSGVAATAAASPTVCTPGSNYRPVSGTLSFGAWETSKSFWIPLCPDGVVAPAPKVVGLSLSTPQPNGVAHLGPWPSANLTISNVDVGGTLRWTSSQYWVSELSSKVLLTVFRSGGAAGNVTVDYVIASGTATAGADFTGPGGGPLGGTLTFPANVMSRTLAIPVLSHDGAEPDETLTVTLQNAQGGATVDSPGVATVTIIDNDRTGTVQFAQTTVTVPEYAASATLTVFRTGSTSLAASVPYQITGKTAAVDPATSLSGTVSFQPGQGSVPLVIHLVDDSSVDPGATLAVTLAPPVSGNLGLGTPKAATVKLVDDEGTVQFAGATFTVSEGTGAATITLTRTGGTARPTTVHFATGDPGDSASPSTAAVACSAGADYRPIVDGSLTFNPGETSRTFIVPLCGDDVVETPNPETLTLRLLSVSPPATPGAQSTAVLRIQENDAGGALRFGSAGYSVTEGAPTAILTVLRANGAAGSVRVPWSIGGSAVRDTDYSGSTSGWLDFGPFQTSASLPVTILNDTLVDGVKTVVVTLGTPTGGAILGSPSVATLSINDNEPSVRFSSPTYFVGESSTGVGVTVIRGGATNSAVTVNVKTTGPGTAEGGPGPCGTGIDFTAVSLPVPFNPGETVKTVTIPLCPDTDADGIETIGLFLDDVSGATLGAPNAATLQIFEDDVAGTVQFAAAASSVSESQSAASVLVTRTGGSASGVKAHWTIVGGTAIAGVDFDGATSGWVPPFGDKQMSQGLAIPIKPRAGVQGPRSVKLLLDLPGGGGALGARISTTLWILDAD
jgi:glucose/arabinose dehydrogenase